MAVPFSAAARAAGQLVVALAPALELEGDLAPPRDERPDEQEPGEEEEIRPPRSRAAQLDLAAHRALHRRGTGARLDGERVFPRMQAREFGDVDRAAVDLAVDRLVAEAAHEPRPRARVDLRHRELELEPGVVRIRGRAHGDRTRGALQLEGGRDGARA